MGAVLAALFGMRTGRRWAVVIGCVLVTIGGALQAAATSQSLMLAGRIVAVSLGLTKILLTSEVHLIR